MQAAEINYLLEQNYHKFNQPDFIPDDPVSIPHQFTLQQDIEISGLFAAMLAWGQRKTIISKCNELLQRFDYAPYDFIKNHQEQDLKALLGFKHRTFNDTDLLYLVYFLHQFYNEHSSLELAFVGPDVIKILNQKDRLEYFHNLVFLTRSAGPHPQAYLYTSA